MSAEDIWWVVKSGDAEDVQALVDAKGLNVNVTDENGRTPLHVAADYGHVDVLKYLIQKGGKVDVKDKHGITPLLAAVWESHEPAVAYLLSVGADAKGSAPDGKSYVACATDDQIKTLLRAKGAK